MNSLPDSLADALGRVVADVQREARKDMERVTAESRLVVAELRADILGFKADLKAATDRELARIPEALANVKDGEAGKPGADGQPGKDGANGENGTPGKDGADGVNGQDGKDGVDGKDADPEAIAELVATATGSLPPPVDGKDGKDGVDGAEGAPGRDGRDGLSGVQGEKGFDGRNGADGINGKDGVNGLDGLGFDDLSVEHDGERTVTLRFVRGEQVKEFPLVFSVPLYRGVYKAGTQYQKGDSVTFGGSTHIAQIDTTQKPETGKDWVLAIKRGRDGKDGKNGERGPQGLEGKSGRDLTQIGTGGEKW